MLLTGGLDAFESVIKMGFPIIYAFFANILEHCFAHQWPLEAVLALLEK